MESKMIFSIARRFRHFNVGIWIVLKKERKKEHIHVRSTIWQAGIWILERKEHTVTHTHAYTHTHTFAQRFGLSEEKNTHGDTDTCLHTHTQGMPH